MYPASSLLRAGTRGSYALQLIFFLLSGILASEFSSPFFHTACYLLGRRRSDQRESEHGNPICRPRAARVGTRRVPLWEILNCEPAQFGGCAFFSFSFLFFFFVSSLFYFSFLFFA
jgi:hypothetical protein